MIINIWIYKLALKGNTSTYSRLQAAIVNRILHATLRVTDGVQHVGIGCHCVAHLNDISAEVTQLAYADASVSLMSRTACMWS